MFSINIYLRFALMALTLIGGFILMFLKGFGFWYGFPLVLIGIILTVGYILLGTVQSSAMMFQTQDLAMLPEIKKRLGLTFFPQWLYKFNRAYYYMLLGNMATQEKDFDEAEKQFLVAQSIGLPSDNEKAMILMALANFRAQKNNWAGAENFFRQVKDLKVTEPMLKEQIKEMDKAMKQRGQAQMQMRGDMRGFRPGSKRPRPKTR